MPVFAGNVATQLTRARLVDMLRKHNLNVRPRLAVDDHLEPNSHNYGIDNKELMPESKTSNELHYSAPTHYDERFESLERLEKHEQRGLGRLLEDRCKKAVLALFKEAHKRAKERFYTPVFKAMSRPS